MSLATTRRGDVLLEFHPGDALDIPENERSVPMPLALVMAQYQGNVLFIFNRWRDEWELPGGLIEDGETPEQAAIREFYEETGQQVDSVRYVGWMKFRLKPDDRLELAVLYTCELDTIRPFEINEEATAMMLWDMRSPVEGYVNAIDLRLTELAIQKP